MIIKIITIYIRIVKFKLLFYVTLFYAIFTLEIALISLEIV